MIRGKQVSGPFLWKPDIFMWGGMLFVSWLGQSLIIPIPDPTIKRLQEMGYDPIDGNPRVRNYENS